jgi:hypothetical protein
MYICLKDRNNMNKCGCYDPGFILGLLTGAQNGRALNVWLQEELVHVQSQEKMIPLSEKDIAWMGSAGDAERIVDLLTLSREIIHGLDSIADLSLDVKGAQGMKVLLGQFISQLSRGVRIINLVFSAPGTDAMQAKIHLTIRLLRSILLSLKSDVLLMPCNAGSGLERDSLWGNTLNEAHLVYNDDLPRVLSQCLKEGDASVLSEWAGMVRLPGTNVAYFNYLPADTFFQEEHVFPALAVSLAFSGLAGIGSLPAQMDLTQIRKLMQARQKSTVFQPSSAQMVININRQIFALMKIAPDAQQMALCLVNLTGESVHIYPDAGELGLPEAGWLDLISNQPYSLGEKGITLAGYNAVWLNQPV